MAYSFCFDFVAEAEYRKKLWKFKTANNMEWFVQENWTFPRLGFASLFSRMKEQSYSHEIALMSAEMDRYFAEIVISSAEDLNSPKKIVKRLDLCKKWILEIPFVDYKHHFIPITSSLPIFLRCTVHLYPLFHLKKPHCVSLTECLSDVPELIEDDETSSDLSTDMKMLLDEGTLSDVVVKSGVTERRVHRNILASRSPVFAMMFETIDVKDKDQEITLLDMGNDVLQEMLTFIYTGIATLSNASLARRLHSIADKYEIKDLKNLCSSYLHEIATKHDVDTV